MNLAGDQTRKQMQKKTMKIKIKIKIARGKDEKVVRVVKEMKKADVKVLRDD